MPALLKLRWIRVGLLSGLLLFYFSSPFATAKVTIAASIPKPVQTLKDAAEAAIRNNPDLLASADSYKIAIKQARQTFSGFLPSVTTEYTYGPEETQNSTSRTDGYQGFRDLMRREASVDASQLIFDANQTLNNYDEAKTNIIVAGDNYIDTRQNLLLTVVQVYTNILRLKETHNVYKKTFAVYRDILDKTKKNYKAGAGQKPEVSLAQSRVGQTEAEIKNLQSQREIANYNYFKVVGIKPENLTKVMLPHYKIPKTLMEAEQMGLRNNPALRSAASTIQANQYGVLSAKGKFFPKLALKADASRGMDLDGTKGSNNDQEVLLDATFNVFNGGADKANLDQARLELQQSVHQYESVKLSILENIRAAWDTFHSIKKQLPILRNTLKEEKYTAYAYNKQYIIGRRTLLDLLTVEGSVFRAKLALLNAKYDMIVSAYSLLAAMGKIEEQQV